MPNCNQIVNMTGEKVVTKAGSKSFLRRFAEKIGLVQREVAECRGKSLSEMAEMTSKKDVVCIGKMRKANSIADAEALIKDAKEKKKLLENEICHITNFDIRSLQEEQAGLIKRASNTEASADNLARRQLQTKYGHDFVDKYGHDYIDEYKCTQKSIARLKQDLKQCGGIGEAQAEDSLVIQDYLAHSKYHDIKATIYQQEQKLQKLEKYYKEYISEITKLKQKVLEDKEAAEQIGNRIKELEDVVSTKERQSIQLTKDIDDLYAQLGSFYN